MRRSNFNAILWFILSLLISVINDSITKLLNDSMSSITVSFWRFVFSTIILLPIVLYYGVSSIKTSKLFTHSFRGLILAGAMSLWAYGIRFVPISTVTLMSFTIPMFTVLMASIFLQEKIMPGTIIATIFGFIGSITALSPKGITFSLSAGIFVIASILFATLDIINKKLINEKEKTLPMMFYSNLFSAIFILFIPSTNILEIELRELFLLFLLGIGANLILFCIIKAFSYGKASLLAPIRYVELLISALIGFIFFNESVSFNVILGGSLIVLSSILIDKKIVHGIKKKDPAY